MNWSSCQHELLWWVGLVSAVNVDRISMRNYLKLDAVPPYTLPLNLPGSGQMLLMFTFPRNLWIWSNALNVQWVDFPPSCYGVCDVGRTSASLFKLFQQILTSEMCIHHPTRLDARRGWRSAYVKFYVHARSSVQELEQNVLRTPLRQTVFKTLPPPFKTGGGSQLYVERPCHFLFPCIA